ncbi:MAG: circularly permuted type 2 ATP-grasp protein [Aquabacterium sp.]|nr:circularly permuted type 2 ATP-grasp protein [Aquabacterium sp.]
MSSTLQLFDDPDEPLSVAADMQRQARAVEPGHYDELRDEHGQLRPVWRAFAEHLGAPLSDLTRRQSLLAHQIQEDGVTYNVYNAQGGPSRPWSLEALPLILSAADWHALERGVAQRARLLDHVLADVYGEQAILKDASLPSALVLGHPSYVRGLQGVKPVGGVYLHVVAFDLVRGPDGAWWVVSQRTQAPSGLGYVMQNRLIVSRLFPEAYRAMNVQHLASGYRRLLDTMTELASRCAEGETPRLALLTPGPYNETYFEHAYLARYLGLPLVEGGDLVVRDEALFLKTVQGLEPIHGLLRRLDDDFCDPLELRADSTLGIPGLMQAVRAGKVVLANALGTGFLESPAVHGFLPALSRKLLGEELALPSLPTWWCGEAAAWQDVKDELTESVIRPSFPHAGTPGFGGASTVRQNFDAVIGRMLPPAALKAWRDRIDHDPAAYTVQRFEPYAQAPVWSGNALTMRGASLRVYALSDGQGGWQVLPGGMTRIATRDAGPVSMQLGGSSLDTWVLTDEAVDTFSMLPASIKLDELMQRQRPVASRTGENLFWMGRYTERTEQQLRLLQALVSLQSGDDEMQDSVSRALSDLAEANGLVPTGTPNLIQSPRVFERAALDALADAAATQGAYSLGFNLAALARSAQSLRERLSPEHARLLRAMGGDFQHRLAQAAMPADEQAMADDAEAPAAHAAAPTRLRSLTQVQDAFEHLGMQLAAVTGAQTDRMTRDPGWRLLTVGRLIERLTGYACMLKAFWVSEALAHPQGFDLALDLFDSTITFRARFQRRLEVPALLAMLVMDETNPRALACVLRRLRTELGKLPVRGGSHADMLALLPHEGVGATLAELCEAGKGQEAVLALLNRLIDAGWRLSDEVGRRYFAHAEPTDSMVSA